MQVRDYELDQFNVVNNANYASYFQHGRHEAFAALGRDVDSYNRSGTPLALSQLNISFRTPLRSRDVFRVTVTAERVTAARLVLHQRILRQLPPPPPAAACGEGSTATAAAEELVAEAQATVVFLDAQYRAARVPRDVAQLFQALVDMRAAAVQAGPVAAGKL